MPVTKIRSETQIVADSIFDAQVAPTAAIQLSKISLSGNLAAVQALASTGMVVQTGAGTFAERSLTQPAAGFTITNANGVAGNPTFVLANDLAALEGLATTGIAVRTSTDTWATRTITGTSNRITLTNGDGVSGNPVIDISAAYVGQATITTLGTITTGVWTGTTIATTNGGTGLTAIGSANQVLGVNAGATGLEYKSLAAGTGISITHGANLITVASTAAASELATVMVTKTTTTALTTSYADIAWNSQVVENDTSIIEWISGTNITVKETGTYLISYTFTDNNTAGHTLQLRVRANSSTVLPGSSITYFDTGVQDSQNPSFAVTLTANDTLQLQALSSPGATYPANGITMTVVRLKGAKGDPGAAGTPGSGSTLNIYDEGVLVSGSPFSSLNFVGSSITATNAGGGQAAITVTATGGTPASPTNSIQYNNAGTFGGSANNIWDNTNSIQTIAGAALQNRLTLHSGAEAIDTAQQATTALYIQVDGDTQFEGMRTWFNRTTAGIDGWITYHYDGSTPNIRITDEDDDSPYVAFQVIGSGTYAAPQYDNRFGGRGPNAAATTGFKWTVSGTDVASLDSQFFSQPIGTTAQRPTPTVGMSRFNSTLNRDEVYVANTWVSNPGLLDKSTVPVVLTTTGGGNLVSYVVPGGTLSTDSILRVQLAGMWSNASGANRQCTLSVSFGGTTMWTDLSSNLSTGNTVGWNIDLRVISDNSATAQTLTGVVHIGGIGASGGNTGDLGSDEILSQAIVRGTSAVNTASNQTLVVSVTFTGGTITWTKDYHIIELI